jgi:5'-3' exonuclease
MPKLVPIEQAKQIIIWDTSNLAYRCYYQKGLISMTTSEGLPSGHIQGLFMKLQAFIRDQISKDTALVFALDKHPIRKYELFPDYKGQRVHSKFNPIPDVIKFLSYLPCTMVWADDEECDDAIASFCYQNLDKPIRIITADSDMWQLLRLPHVSLGEKDLITDKRLEDDFGLTKETSYKIALYKAIRGDVSDNIPCIPYLFPKVKKAFYACNGTVKDLLVQASSDDKMTALLKEHEEQIKRMYQLTKLRRDLEVHSHWHDGNEKFMKFYLRTLEVVKYLQRTSQFFS